MSTKNNPEGQPSKSRLNFRGFCMKPCKHQGTKICEDLCYKYSRFELDEDAYAEILKQTSKHMLKEK
jgi:hypothetical protein